MATTAAPPDPQLLIPSLLAALPTSFASSKPPPSLLSLVSPILQQRLQIHTSTPGSEHDSWLRLLCWDKTKAEKLKDTVENGTFEPHPSSGELEVGEVMAITYKRFDEETLKAQIPLADWDLTAIYLWCSEGDSGSMWKLAELTPFDSELAADSSWTPALNEVASSSATAGLTNTKSSQPSVQSDDDNYWAMYDGSASQTPARQGSIKPPVAGGSEDDYYARYGDVQPALDNDDPDEAHEDVGQSTLTGSAFQRVLSSGGATATPPTFPNFGIGDRSGDEDDVVHITHPVPTPPGPGALSNLESRADHYSTSDIAIRQHISTTMKSMYRLAKAAGIPRDDFDDMVQRELDTLSIFDAND